MSILRRCLCVLLGGHDRLRKWEKERICLRCVTCGHESPGWLVKSKKEGAA